MERVYCAETSEFCYNVQKQQTAVFGYLFKEHLSFGPPVQKNAHLTAVATFGRFVFCCCMYRDAAMSYPVAVILLTTPAGVVASYVVF